MIQHYPTLHLSDSTQVSDTFERPLIWTITDTHIIGRELADITIDLPMLSRQHAKVILSGALCQIQDLNSKNGTAVNGTVLKNEPWQLRHGDSITLAGAVELQFTDPNATPVAPRLGKLCGLWIDPETEDVWIDAQKLVPPLSQQQFSLLCLIEQAQGQLIDKDEIIASIWPSRPPGTVSNDAIDSLIKRLRRRLAEIDHGNPVLDVVRSRGIRLKQNR